jgi:hypothetical protein
MTSIGKYRSIGGREVREYREEGDDGGATMAVVCFIAFLELLIVLHTEGLDYLLYKVVGSGLNSVRGVRAMRLAACNKVIREEHFGLQELRACQCREVLGDLGSDNDSHFMREL